jgi:hypothetical protein
MKKCFLGALIAMSGLFGLATGARAQTTAVVVNIKQDFIAGGKALPAGKYRVVQDFSGSAQVLTLRGDQPGASVFLLPTAYDGSVPRRLQVKLTQVGDVYYLSEVATESGVYTLAPSSVVTNMAKAGDLGRTSSSGSD